MDVLLEARTFMFQNVICVNYFVSSATGFV